MADSIDRRRFLEWLALATGGALVGCDDGTSAAEVVDAGVADMALPPGLDVPFGVWRAMLEAVRESPDHLVAQADARVEAGDPEALLGFVRDAVRLVPDTADDTQDGAEAVMRWGPKGALRCGTGTARCKAELLASLYRRAGLVADVVAAPVDVRGAALRALYLRGDDPAFAPAVSEAALAEWRDALEPTPAPRTPPPDLDGALTDALGERLVQAIPESWYRKARDIGTRLRRVPLVRVRDGGAVRYANPVLLDVPYGEHGADAEPEDAAEAEVAPVRVAFGYTRSDSGDEVQPLVERSWTAEEVVGRQVQVQLAPALDFDTLVGTDLEAVRMFVPTLSVRGPDVDVAAGEALLAVGDPLSLDGERVTRDPDTGAVQVDGEPVEVVAGGAPAALADVERLEISVSGASYPRVGVRVRALGADGESVGGLTVDAFRVEEEETPRQPLLMTSLSKPPRVLFILDVSVSVPPAFRREGAAAIARDVAQRVVAEIPDAQFRSSSLISGYRLYGQWTSDPEALHRASLEAASTSSSLWFAAAEATKQKPTLIVMITDGAATDESNDGRLRAIIAGPPIVGIHVTDGERGAAFLGELAELTDGAYFPVAEPEEAVEAIVGFLDIERKTRYRLRYSALAEGPEVRAVRVSTADGRLSAEGSYRVPPEGQRTPRPYLTGLFLTVEASGRSVTRLLAGYDDSGAFPGPDDPGVWAAVRDQFFGVTTVSFEGGAPTASAWLDDLLTARLSHEPVFRALEAGDFEAARAGMAEVGVRSLHSEVVVAHPPLPRTPEAATFETGLRVVAFTERPNFAAGTFEERVDLLPLTRYASVAESPTVAFQTTVRRTARLAIHEAARYDESTVSLLDGVELAPYTSGSRRLPAALADSEHRARWGRLTPRSGTFHRLVPAGGEPFAWWTVHELLGSVRGLLADGSGGGNRAAQIRGEIAEVKRFFAALKLFYTVRGGASPVVGVAVAYASALAGLYGTAAIVISTLRVGQADLEVRREIAELACNALSEIVPFLPTGVSLASDIIEVLTGTSFCSAIVAAAS